MDSCSQLSYKRNFGFLGRLYLRRNSSNKAATIAAKANTPTVIPALDPAFKDLCLVLENEGRAVILSKDGV